ncbi:MAG: deoxyhypusine synthase family protein [Thaumarchaeota archaeon]|nr:deoxyhypusine synthase family protein [Nitrososphaerota archaeon]
MRHPVGPYDGEKVSNVSDALRSFNEMGFQSRNLGRCYNILIKMLTDNDRPTVMMALAGAMIPGGLRKVVRDLIYYRIVDVLVSTGANLYHDVYEALGNRHFLAEGDVSDVELREHRINRMYDVYADDLRFYDTDDYIKELADKLEPKSYSTREFLYLLGKTLRDANSIVGTAAKLGTPIYCPAISDSSIGLALTEYLHHMLKDGKKPITIDVLKDNLEFVDIKVHAKKTAVIMVGGGVPKNYVQQVTPMAEVLGIDVEGHTYGVSITTDHPEWGGLSGCTFEESQSWGKYLPDAFFATVNSDATIALPLLLQGVLEQKKLWHPRSAPDFSLLK